MSLDNVSARFDDRRGSFELRRPVRVMVAYELDDVIGTLEAVEAAAHDGLWCAGFVAYESGPAFDSALVTHPPDPDLPLVWFGAFADRIAVNRPVGNDYEVERWYPNISERTYSESIDRIRAYIAAGESYQVNHTFRLRSKFRGDPKGLYADLVTAQRGDYSVFLDIGSHQIASASPELFFHWTPGRIEVKPMKGTTRRGRWSEEDEERAAWLRSSEKDRAENLMIVDLLRNDVGKLARIGSVRAEPLFVLERYETVWQLTSTITADLDSSVRLRDVFAGLFPSGSITGAPKARTMEIIEELEIDPRGVYCGGIGIIRPGPDGIDAEFNVAIRTVTIDAATGIAEFGVGGGITWDSTSAGEYQEALWKTAVLSGASRDFGLFETLRWEGEFFFLDEHLDRLARSAAYFDFPCSRADLEVALKMASRDVHGPSRVRLELDANGAATATATGTLTAPFADDIDGADEVSVQLAGTPVQPHDRLLFHKTTHRVVYDRARSEVVADDAILINAHGELTESTISNLVMRIAGVWYTPPLESGCLPGIYRQHLIEQGKVNERVLRIRDLDSCEAIGLVNSVRGWRKAQLV